MQSFSFRLSREEEEKLLRPHEYIRDTLSFRYQNCISCGTRTEFTCIKCGYCYSCHWKKEQIEETELRNNLKDFYTSLSKASNDLADNVNNDLELRTQQVKEGEKRQGKRLTLDVFGQQAEPICTYYRCHHKFSVHGSRKCRCKHPTNKTLGIFWSINEKE
jgi:hypothetical protein